MTKTIIIPEYILKSVLRHYKILSEAHISYDDIKALNAKRVACKEIQKLERIIQKQQYYGI